MSDFLIAYNRTNGNEGGLSDNPHDKGKFTYRGIASAFWPNWKGWPIVHATVAKYNGDFKLANKDLANNTALQSLVKGFYMANFWNVLSLSQIYDQQIANNLYDFEVNAGTGAAAFAIQKACNDIFPAGKGITVDGGVGIKTIAAINSLPGKQLYDMLNNERLKYYQSLADWKYFGDAWKSRLIPYVN